MCLAHCPPTRADANGANDAPVISLEFAAPRVGHVVEEGGAVVVTTRVCCTRRTGSRAKRCYDSAGRIVSDTTGGADATGDSVDDPCFSVPKDGQVRAVHLCGVYVAQGNAADVPPPSCRRACVCRSGVPVV